MGAVESGDLGIFYPQLRHVGAWFTACSSAAGEMGMENHAEFTSCPAGAIHSLLPSCKGRNDDDKLATIHGLGHLVCRAVG